MVFACELRGQVIESKFRRPHKISQLKGRSREIYNIPLNKSDVYVRVKVKQKCQIV